MLHISTLQWLANVAYLDRWCVIRAHLNHQKSQPCFSLVLALEAKFSLSYNGPKPFPSPYPFNLMPRANTPLMTCKQHSSSKSFKSCFGSFAFPFLVPCCYHIILLSSFSPFLSVSLSVYLTLRGQSSLQQRLALLPSCSSSPLIFTNTQSKPLFLQDTSCKTKKCKPLQVGTVRVSRWYSDTNGE